MDEMTVQVAAARLEISEQRVRQLLAAGELRGRRIGGSIWLVQSRSVQDRIRLAPAKGRPLSLEKYWAVLHELTASAYESVENAADAAAEATDAGRAVDTKVAELIVKTDVDQLWRKLAQMVTVQRFDARRIEVARKLLIPTGESAVQQIDDELIGTAESATVHGYLGDTTLDDLIDEAGMIPSADGNVVIYQTRTDSDSRYWERFERDFARAAIAADCARSTTTRVHSAGVRALGEMRAKWLATHI